MPGLQLYFGASPGPGFDKLFASPTLGIPRCLGVYRRSLAMSGLVDTRFLPVRLFTMRGRSLHGDRRRLGRMPVARCPGCRRSESKSEEQQDFRGVIAHKRFGAENNQSNFYPSRRVYRV